MGGKCDDVDRVSDPTIVVKLVINEMIVSVVSVYTSQAGLCESLKDSFYGLLQNTVAKFSHSETWFIGGNFNEHFGKYANNLGGVQDLILQTPPDSKTKPFVLKLVAGSSKILV